MVKVVLPKGNTEELAEETGIHVGDGSMNFYPKRGIVSIAGHPTEDKGYYEDYIVPLYMKLYGIKPNLRHWSGAYGFQVCSDVLVKFKKGLGLPTGPKKNIEAPRWIMSGTTSIQAAFLRGMFDTDGTFYIEKKKGAGYPRIQIRTTSAALAQDIKELMINLGLRPSLWMEKPKNSRWSNHYAIAIRGSEQIRMWMRIVGTSNPKNKGKYVIWKKSINKKRFC